MVRLNEQTTTTAGKAFTDASVAVLPTGSTEQHGPALPLGTDSMAATAVADAVVDRKDVVVLPTVPVGVSDHHRQFDGTLSVAPGAFEDYVYDILSSMAGHSVRKAIVVNGHGGNTDALTRAARRLRGDRRCFVAPWNWWAPLSDLPEEDFGGDIGHADAVETSMVYRVAPDLVREDALDAAETNGAEEWGKTIHGAAVGFDTADFSESGAVGEPTRGSPEAGEKLFDRSVEELDRLIDWLCEKSVEELWPASHR